MCSNKDNLLMIIEEDQYVTIWLCVILVRQTQRVFINLINYQREGKRESNEVIDHFSSLKITYE